MCFFCTDVYSWLYLWLFDWKSATGWKWGTGWPLCQSALLRVRYYGTHNLSGCLNTGPIVNESACHATWLLWEQCGQPFPVKNGITDPYPASQKVPEGSAEKNCSLVLSQFFFSGCFVLQPVSLVLCSPFLFSLCVFFFSSTEETVEEFSYAKSLWLFCCVTASLAQSMKLCFATELLENW